MRGHGLDGQLEFEMFNERFMAFSLDQEIGVVQDMHTKKQDKTQRGTKMGTMGTSLKRLSTMLTPTPPISAEQSPVFCPTARRNVEAWKSGFNVTAGVILSS